MRIAVLLAILLWPIPASAYWINVRWTQAPANPPVTDFLIYEGSNPYSGAFVDSVFPEPDAEGVYATDLWLDDGISIYIWLTAVNFYGESLPSNAVFYPLPEPPGILQLIAGVAGLAFLRWRCRA